MQQPPAFVWRISAFYVALFLVAGVHLPYLPLWLEAQGLTERELALCVALPMLLRALITPLAGYVIERHLALRPALILLGAGTVLAMTLLSAASGLWQILAALVVFVLFSATIMPITEALAMAGARAGHDYGRMRLWGSASFVAVSVAAGLVVDAHGAAAIVALLAAGTVAVTGAALFIVEPPGTAVRAPPGMADFARLARDGRLWAIIAAGGLLQGSHAVFYTFGSVHWGRLGYSPTVIGTLWGFGVVAEIALFAVSRPLVARFGAERLMVAAALAGIARWALSASDPPLPALFALQALHAGTFAAGHLAAMHLLTRHFPPPISATAQAFYAAGAMGLAMGCGTLAAGPLYAALAGQAYAVMAAQCVVALIIAARFARHSQPHNSGAAGNTAGPSV